MDILELIGWDTNWIYRRGWMPVNNNGWGGGGFGLINSDTFPLDAIYEYTKLS